MKTNYLFSLFLTTLIFFSCSNTQKSTEYAKAESLYISRNDLETTDEISELGKAYVIYLNITETEAVFKCRIVCSVNTSDSIRTPQTFFILEKYINTEKFGNVRKKYVFTEIIRNYSPDWTVSNPLTVNQENALFMRKITKGIYRIVFTCFITGNFDAFIEIKSDSTIGIYKSLDDALKMSAFNKES